MSTSLDTRRDHKLTAAPARLMARFLSGEGEELRFTLRKKAGENVSDESADLANPPPILGRTLGVWVCWWVGEGQPLTAHLTEVKVCEDPLGTAA